MGPNRSASSSCMMIMKTNRSLARRWNHMRITVHSSHACVCIQSNSPKCNHLLGLRQNKPLLSMDLWKGGEFQCGLIYHCICILCYVWLFAHRLQKHNESVVPVLEVSLVITLNRSEWCYTYFLHGHHQYGHWILHVLLSHSCIQIYAVHLCSWKIWH